MSMLENLDDEDEESNTSQEYKAFKRSQMERVENYNRDGYGTGYESDTGTSNSPYPTFVLQPNMDIRDRWGFLDRGYGFNADLNMLTTVPRHLVLANNQNVDQELVRYDPRIRPYNEETKQLQSRNEEAKLNTLLLQIHEYSNTAAKFIQAQRIVQRNIDKVQRDIDNIDDEIKQYNEMETFFRNNSRSR